MKRKLVVGNWKMNGGLVANHALLGAILEGMGQGFESCEAAVCVPAPYLSQCQAKLNETALCWGVQDVSAYNSGAYTGEVSAAMLKDFGCSYAIVGHSERRLHHGETDMLVAEKAARAIQQGIRPIVCLGETLEEREVGTTNAVVIRQLQIVLEALSDDEISALVVAYEPLWAIGTGKAATPQMAQDVHAVLRECLSARAPYGQDVPILYGGSMKPANAEALLKMKDIDGGLIGGASLESSEFLSLIRSAAAAVQV